MIIFGREFLGSRFGAEGGGDTEWGEGDPGRLKLFLDTFARN